MKQKVLRLCIMLIAFAMLPSMTEAKKIKFGNYITYDGKIENGLPMGAGKLIIVNKDPKVKKPAIVEGIFDGWKVGSIGDPALVHFYSQDYYPYYFGQTEIQIAEDGSTVTIKLISGTFIDSFNDISFDRETNYNIVMTCTPKEDGIYISSTPFDLEKQIKKEKDSKFRDKYHHHLPNEPFGQAYDSKGKVVDCYTWKSICTCQYEGKNNVKKSNYHEVFQGQFLHPNMKYIMRENTIEENYGEDTFVFEAKEVKDKNIFDIMLSFSKKVIEGTLNYQNDTLTLTDLNGKQHTVLYYDFGQWKLFEQPRLFDRGYSLENLGLRIIEGAAYTAARKLVGGREDTKAEFELGIAYLNGDGVKADKETGNRWIQHAYERGGQEAKAYLAEQEAKAEEELLKQAASYGAHQDDDGMLFVQNMKKIEAGTESAIINIGLCYQFGYGVDKNVTKAFEYYKKASNANDEAVKACGNFLMGMCYWKGEGTAKNQAQAFKSWTNYTDYSSKKFVDFNDWIGRWTNEELRQLVRPREMLGYKHYYHAQCYEQGIGTQKYLEEAIAFYAAAVQWKDIADAWYKLGYYAEKGKYATILGFIQDRNYIRQCYRKAAQLGSNQAKQALNRM